MVSVEETFRSLRTAKVGCTELATSARFTFARSTACVTVASEWIESNFTWAKFWVWSARITK